MSQTKLSWMMICSLLLLTLVASCAPSPTTPTQDSPLSPAATPPSTSGAPTVDLEGWASGDLDGLYVSYIEIQIFEPLAWTGIDWDGEYFWIANNVTQEIVALGEDGETMHSLAFPSIDDLPVNVSGVAKVGQNVWIADVAHEMFYALDQESGEVMEEFAFEGTAQGVDWDGSAFWVATVDGPQLQRISQEGEVLDTYDTERAWITGVAWDGGRVWYVDPTSQEVWTLNPNSRQHAQQTDFTSLTNQLSFNAIDFAGEYLLLFNDMIGRLYATSVR